MTSANHLNPDLQVNSDSLPWGKPTMRPLRPLAAPSKRPVQVDAVLHGAALQGDDAINGLSVWNRRGDPNLRGNRDGRTRMERSIALPLLRPDANEVKWKSRDPFPTNLEERGPNAHDNAAAMVKNGVKVVGRPFTSIDQLAGVNLRIDQPVVKGATTFGRNFTTITGNSGVNVRNDNPVANLGTNVGRNFNTVTGNSGLTTLLADVIQKGASVMGQGFTTVTGNSGVNMRDVNPVTGLGNVIGRNFNTVTGNSGVNMRDINPITGLGNTMGRNFNTVTGNSGLNMLLDDVIQNGATVMGSNFTTVTGNSGINMRNDNPVANLGTTLGNPFNVVSADSSLNTQTPGDIKSTEAKLRQQVKYVEEQSWGDPNNANMHGLNSMPAPKVIDVVPHIEEITPVVLKGGGQAVQYQPLPIRAGRLNRN